MVGEGEMMTIALPNTTSSGLGILTNSNTKSLSFDGNDYVSINACNDLKIIFWVPGIWRSNLNKHNNSDNHGVLIHSTYNFR